MLRYTTFNNTIYSFINMWVIPKVMPQIIEELFLLLVGEVRWNIFSNGKIGIIIIPRRTAASINSSKLLIGKIIINRQWVIKYIFHTRQLICYRIIISLSINDTQSNS